MKITISKTRIAIALSIAYIIWMILITIGRITQIFLPYFFNIVFSSIFTLIYAWVYFYLAAILKSKGQKKAILVSFMIFITISTIFSALNIAHQFDYRVMVAMGIINFPISINLVVQCIRVKDDTVGTLFKILGITMLFKIMILIALPFVSVYLADYFSSKSLYLNNLTPAIDIVPMLIICTIFLQVLTELKEQQKIWAQVELNDTYKLNRFD